MILKYLRWKRFCLCTGWEETREPVKIPEGAEMVSEPFSPLVFLTWRDPLNSRGLTSVRALAELTEKEGPDLLCPVSAKAAVTKENETSGAEDGAFAGACDAAVLKALVGNEGASLLNTAFGRAYDVLEKTADLKKRFKITLVGLGDVGGTVLTGLKLLGREVDEVSIFDPNDAMCRRYEMELNQVLPVSETETMPEVTICREEQLFDCDLFAFTASRGVPGLGTDVKDVRMAQYEANRGMLSYYAKKAREAHFTGIFCQISDPVDHLSRAVFLDSQKNEDGVMDFNGLLPEQVQGFGLGVMAARAAYYADKEGIDFSEGRAYGPHGVGLIVADRWDTEYNDDISCRLTELAGCANLKVRDLGFKPYIAPGLSSAAVSLLKLIRGEFHYGAVPVDGVYFGCKSRMTCKGLEIKREAVNNRILARIYETHEMLKIFKY